MRTVTEASRGIFASSYARPKAFFEMLESRLLLSTAPVPLTPIQVRHAYGFDQVTFNNGTIQGDGSGQTIAIVDAYADSNIASDLDTFDKTEMLNSTQTLYAAYGSAAKALTVHAMASRMSTDSGWAMETSLDVEWAHAIAPGAHILLVQAKTSGLGDLLNAINYARSQSAVATISMSWGAGEFSTETLYDSYFTTPSGHKGITFFASAGDSGAQALWPAISSNVVGVGGTTLTVNPDNTWNSETAWSGSGGGISAYVSKPAYQAAVTQSATKRTGPDVAYDADPNSGMYVYDSIPYGGYTGWWIVGGTSAGAPQWAALVAIADQGRTLAGQTTLNGKTQTLNALYNMSQTYFHDIVSGSNGYPAGTGYDLVTGRGTPLANLVIQSLLTASSTGTVTPLQLASTQSLTGSASSTAVVSPGAPSTTMDSDQPVSLQASDPTAPAPSATGSVLHAKPQLAIFEAMATASVLTEQGDYVPMAPESADDTPSSSADAAQGGDAAGLFADLL